MKNLMKIRQIGAELLYADRQTDVQKNRQEGMMKLTVVFPNFESAPKNVNRQVTAFSIELHCYFEIGRKYP